MIGNRRLGDSREPALEKNAPVQLPDRPGIERNGSNQRSTALAISLYSSEF